MKEKLKNSIINTNELKMVMKKEDLVKNIVNFSKVSTFFLAVSCVLWVMVIPFMAVSIILPVLLLLVGIATMTLSNAYRIESRYWGLVFRLTKKQRK